MTEEEPWCVWMLLSGEGEGWSMVHRNMSQSEAQRAEETATFRARAMRAGKAAGYRPEALLPAQLRKPPVGAIVREPGEPAPVRPQGVKVNIFAR